MTLRSVWRSLNYFVLMGLCLGGVAYLQNFELKKQEIKLSSAEYVQEEEKTKLQIDLINNFPSFGFNNLIADWLYLQFIQYFGDTDARKETGYSLSPDYFKAVVKRDPRFVNANFKLAAATSIFAGFPEVTVALLRKSFEYVTPKTPSYPEPAYYQWIYKGIDEMLFLADYEAAKISFTKGAEWADLEITKPESKQIAANLRRRVHFLETNPDSITSRIGAWTLVLSVTSDEQTVLRVISEIEKLGGEVTIFPNGGVYVKVPEEKN